LTASPFPAWWKHPLLVVSMLGSADANAKRFFGVDALLQTNPERLKWSIFASLGLGLLVYGHFVVTVINDICDFYQMK
jgi:ethanolaminephosphotransferase